MDSKKGRRVKQGAFVKSWGNMKNYNTGVIEIGIGGILCLIFWYLYPMTAQVLYESSLLGTSTEETTLKLAAITLFVILCTLALFGIYMVRMGLVYFLYFAHDAIVEYYEKKNEGWL